MLVDEGLLKSLRPEEYATEVAVDLLRFMEEHRTLLRDRFSIRHIASTADGPSWGGSHPEGPSQGLAWIHASKMSYEFESFVHEEGLAKIGRGDDWQWVGVHETVAMAYMMALASHCASANRLAPITDLRTRSLQPVTDVEAAMKLLIGDRADVQPERAPADCAGFAMLAMESVIPRSFAHISIDHILKMRENLAEELSGFRAFISDQREDLEEIASTRDPAVRAEQFVTHLDVKIKQPLAKLRKGYRLLNIETVRGLVSIKTFAPSAAAGFALHNSPTLATVAGVSLVVGSAWWQHNETRRKTNSSLPVGFLLSLDKAVRADLAAKRMMKILQYT